MFNHPLTIRPVLLAALGVIGFCTFGSVHSAHHEQAEAQKPRTLPEVLTDTHHPRPAQDPNYGPRYGSLSFTDSDPGATIGGTLSVGRAVDENGDRVDERNAGITMYMIHWGLEVGEPGVEDDRGAGDHGGDCRGFRDTGYVVKRAVSELDDNDTISWEIPTGTEVPEGAAYFVAHTLYDRIHNLAKCTQIPIDNVQE